MTGKRIKVKPLSARLRQRTVRDANTGCLLWTGAVNNKGYAVTNLGYVHRQVWIEANGPIPEGKELDHSCSTTYCVELTHLEPVTHAENMRRARRSTCRRGHPKVAGQRDCTQCRKLLGW